VRAATKRMRSQPQCDAPTPRAKKCAQTRKKLEATAWRTLLRMTWRTVREASCEMGCNAVCAPLQQQRHQRHDRSRTQRAAILVYCNMAQDLYNDCRLRKQRRDFRRQSGLAQQLMVRGATDDAAGGGDFVRRSRAGYWRWRSCGFGGVWKHCQSSAHVSDGSVRGQVECNWVSRK
jgi:hypothetical protein